MLLLAASFILLSFSVALYQFLIAAALNGLGNGVINPILNSLLIKLCPKDRRGAANGTYFSAIDIGIGVGSVIGGLVSQAFGYPLLYMSSAVCIVFSFAVYYFPVKRQINRKDAIILLNTL